MAVVVWIGKNLGLILGILEIVVVAIVNIVAQVAKVLLGIVNILQPSRQKDALVNWAAKLEAFSHWLDGVFTAIKKWLYSFGGQTT